MVWAAVVAWDADRAEVLRGTDLRMVVEVATIAGRAAAIGTVDPQDVIATADREDETVDATAARGETAVVPAATVCCVMACFAERESPPITRA